MYLKKHGFSTVDKYGSRLGPKVHYLIKLSEQQFKITQSIYENSHLKITPCFCFLFRKHCKVNTVYLAPLFFPSLLNSIIFHSICPVPIIFFLISEGNPAGKGKTFLRDRGEEAMWQKELVPLKWVEVKQRLRTYMYLNCFNSCHKCVY